MIRIRCKKAQYVFPLSTTETVDQIKQQICMNNGLDVSKMIIVFTPEQIQLNQDMFKSIKKRGVDCDRFEVVTGDQNDIGQFWGSLKFSSIEGFTETMNQDCYNHLQPEQYQQTIESQTREAKQIYDIQQTRRQQLQLDQLKTQTEQAKNIQKLDQNQKVCQSNKMDLNPEKQKTQIRFQTRNKVQHLSCSMCNQNLTLPIYLCLICPNFHLCPQCEQSKHAYHSKLKIKTTKQYPEQVKMAFQTQSLQTMLTKQFQDNKLRQQLRKQPIRSQIKFLF